MAGEAHIRSLYRSVLRELPVRAPNTAPTSVQVSIRKHLSNKPTHSSSEYHLARRQEAEQFVQFLKAQRMYKTLLDRYNPGMGMDETERVRLTARRVGMDMPMEWYSEKKKY